MNYVLKRMISTLITLFLVSIILFSLMRIMPGNPYSGIIGPNTSPEVFESLLQEVGYYDPIPVQYFNWLKNFIQGNLGESFVTGQAVTEMIVERLPNTLLLTGTSLFISFFVGAFIGLTAAYHKGSFYDQLTNFLSILLVSFPTFIIALILIKIFAYDLKIFPASGLYDLKVSYQGFDKVKDLLVHLTLPAITLALTQVTYYYKYIRSSFIKVMEADYIKASVAKGQSYAKAICFHGFRNMLIPVLTIFFLQLPILISGALVTETIFVWPGIGKLVYDAVMNRDYMLVMGVLLFISVFILLANLIADILYSLIDKRIEWN